LGAFPAADPRLAANGRTTASSDGGLELHYGGSGIRGEFTGRTFLVLAESFPGDHRQFLGLTVAQPEAEFLLTTTLMHHDREWVSQIDHLASLARDRELPVRTHHFQREAQGSPGHLRIAEEEEMGEELANKILSLDVRWTD
jgi:hypothetical protein